MLLTLSCSSTHIICSCYSNDLSIDFYVVCKYCGSSDGVRRSFFCSWHFLCYGSHNIISVVLRDGQLNLCSNQALIHSGRLSRYSKNVVSCWILPVILMIVQWHPEKTCRWLSVSTIDHDYDVFVTLFLSEKMMESCQPSLTKYLCLLHDLLNSYNTLCTWEITITDLHRIDFIVVLPRRNVLSSYWPLYHIPTHSRPAKHSEQ